MFVEPVVHCSHDRVNLEENCLMVTTLQRVSCGYCYCHLRDRNAFLYRSFPLCGVMTQHSCLGVVLAIAQSLLQLLARQWLSNNFGQVVDTLVALSLRSIIWYR